MLAAMVVHAVTVALVLGACALCACSGLAGIDEPAAPLAAGERALVRAQVDAAVEAGHYRDAWDQEIAAGAERARLEAIALAALEAHSRHAGDMFGALREKWGPLAAERRALVSAHVTTAIGLGKWGHALATELRTADDPPTFSRAWALYRRAPAERAEELLQDIVEARAEVAEEPDAESGD
jgi:hypothetical protein